MNPYTAPLVAAKVEAGKTYHRHGGGGKSFTVLYISADYARNAASVYRGAWVRWADGTEGEHRIYGSQRYIQED